MKLFNLQNKLIRIRHKISKQEFVSMNIPQEQFETLIKAELYKQLADYLMKSMPIQTNPNEYDVEFNAGGYFLSEKDMLNVILEVCQLDDKGRDMLEQSCMKQLGIKIE